MKLTGEGVEDFIVTKTINVQQNPGRGAKVVCPKPRAYPYQQQKVYNIDGSQGKSVIKLKTKFALGIGFIDQPYTMEVHYLLDPGI